jgi:lipoprotein-anchoring transpeptidase ErfK/SrfK
LQRRILNHNDRLSGNRHLSFPVTMNIHQPLILSRQRRGRAWPEGPGRWNEVIMKKTSIVAVAVLACLTALPASAQMAAPRTGNLGGGFIELLVTGRDPTGRAGRPGEPIVAGPPSGAAPRTVRTAAIAPPGLSSYIETTLDPRFERQEVVYEGPHAPGTIVIDTENKFLFLVQSQGRALRYGIGVGRPGFIWTGTKAITRKAEWPSWTPPAEMLKRRPDLPRFMEGGPENPLGSRAMYLGESLYRIHGTNEPNTIGQNVSSGCIRLRNEDVMDLYERVRVGTKVVVI